MVKNVGLQDRNIRYALGALLIVLAIFDWPDLWWVGVLGLIAIGTAYFGTCLAYLPLNINTKKQGE